MVYELNDYAEKIAHCHVNTLIKRIEKQLLPSNHIVYKGKHGQRTVIEIIHGSEHCRACSNVHHAALEFQERKTDSNERELAAELCVKFDIGAVKFFKMMGVK
jgi:hypothetical protein